MEKPRGLYILLSCYLVITNNYYY